MKYLNWRTSIGLFFAVVTSWALALGGEPVRGVLSFVASLGMLSYFILQKERHLHVSIAARTQNAKFHQTLQKQLRGFDLAFKRHLERSGQVSEKQFKQSASIEEKQHKQSELIAESLIPDLDLLKESVRALVDLQKNLDSSFNHIRTETNQAATFSRNLIELSTALDRRTRRILELTSQQLIQRKGDRDEVVALRDGVGKLTGRIGSGFTGLTSTIHVLPESYAIRLAVAGHWQSAFRVTLAGLHILPSVVVIPGFLQAADSLLLSKQKLASGAESKVEFDEASIFAAATLEDLEAPIEVSCRNAAEQGLLADIIDIFDLGERLVGVVNASSLAPGIGE